MPNIPAKESDKRDAVYNELESKYKESDERDMLYSRLISRSKAQTQTQTDPVNKSNETDYDKLLDEYVNKYKAQAEINQSDTTNPLHDEQANKTQDQKINVISKKKIAGIVGASMLAGVFFGASLASTFASYISPSFAIPVIGQFIGLGALGLIAAATIISAAAGGIAGSIGAYKEYQGSKSGKYNTSTTVKNTSNSQNQSNHTVTEFAII